MSPKLALQLTLRNTPRHLVRLEVPAPAHILERPRQHAARGPIAFLGAGVLVKVDNLKALGAVNGRCDGDGAPFEANRDPRIRCIKGDAAT